MFDFLLDLFDLGGSATDAADAGDVHFGSSDLPVCPSCGGTGRSLYPSSGTTGVCYTCGGSGQ